MSKLGSSNKESLIMLAAEAEAKRSFRQMDINGLYQRVVEMQEELLKLKELVVSRDGTITMLSNRLATLEANEQDRKLSSISTGPSVRPGAGEGIIG
jgi:hypothetical protein